MELSQRDIRALDSLISTMDQEVLVLQSLLMEYIITSMKAASVTEIPLECSIHLYFDENTITSVPIKAIQYDEVSEDITILYRDSQDQLSWEELDISAKERIINLVHLELSKHTLI